MDTLIRNARLRSLEGTRDIGIENGVIAAVEERLGGSASKEFDAAGRLLVPGFVNIHLHLDKCLTGAWTGVWESSVSGSPQAIPAATSVKAAFTEADIIERASRALVASITAGTTAIRAFADVDTFTGLLSLKSVLKVKEKFRDVLDMQVVAFPQEGILRNEGTEELLERSMELGADVVGGIPWYEESPASATKHTDIVFKIAEKYGKDVHALIDDNSNPDSCNIEYFLKKAVKEGFNGRVAASHCRGRLDSPDEAYANQIVGLAKLAGLTVVENSHVSLFMYGRNDLHPVRRGVTRVKEFLAAGVNVAVGQDDIDDPYYPFGRGDMLELALIMCHAAHLGSLAEMEKALDMVTYNPARGMSIKDYGIGVGDRADVVLLDSTNVHEALRAQPDRLLVLKGGRPVAETTSRGILHR